MLLGRLKSQLANDHAGAMHRLQTIVEELVDFAFQHPQFFELLKSMGIPKGNPEWDAQRDSMFNLIEQTIRSGVESGELQDAHPYLTARFIPGLVRSAMLFAQTDREPTVLKQQISSLLERGLLSGLPAQV